MANETTMRVMHRAAMAIGAALLFAGAAQGGAREEGRLLTATEVLQEVEGMPDQRLPDLLRQRVAFALSVVGPARGKAVPGTPGGKSRAPPTV